MTDPLETKASLQDMTTPDFLIAFRAKIPSMDPLTAMVVGVLVNRVEAEMKRADRAEAHLASLEEAGVDIHDAP
jgi:hypothetical protein